MLYYIKKKKREDVQKIIGVNKNCLVENEHIDIDNPIKGGTAYWTTCEENVYSQFIYMVLYEDNKINWGRAVATLGFGLILNNVTQFFLTYFIWYENALKVYVNLKNSQDKHFCDMSNILQTFVLIIFIFNMLSKITYLYKNFCIIFSNTFRKKVDNKYHEYKIDPKKYRLCDRFFLLLICWCTELAQWLFVFICGIIYLLFSSNVTDLILNALALNYILDIDELIYLVIVNGYGTPKQVEIKLKSFPALRDDKTNYNIFQCCVAKYFKFLSKYIPPILTISLILYAQDYVQCSFCPGGNYCIVNSNQTIYYEEKIRVLTNYDILWPFLMAFFFIIGEIGNTVDLLERFSLQETSYIKHKEYEIKE